jgi:hypothetical protein
MKTRTFRVDWLIPVLGIALVGGGYFPMKSYLGLQKQIRSGEEFMATVDRLWEDCDLSLIMAQAQYSGCAVAGRSMDELLRAHFAGDRLRFASADPHARAVVQIVSEFIDRRRSESPPMAGDGSAGGKDHEVAGQLILAETLGSVTPGG